MVTIPNSNRKLVETGSNSTPPIHDRSLSWFDTGPSDGINLVVWAQTSALSNKKTRNTTLWNNSKI